MQKGYIFSSLVLTAHPVLVDRPMTKLNGVISSSSILYPAVLVPVFTLPLQPQRQCFCSVLTYIAPSKLCEYQNKNKTKKSEQNWQPVFWKKEENTHKVNKHLFYSKCANIWGKTIFWATNNYSTKKKKNDRNEITSVVFDTILVLTKL